MCHRRILLNGKKVYLVPADQCDAVKAAKPGVTTWAECDARSLGAMTLDCLRKNLLKPDLTNLEKAVALADDFVDQLAHCDRGIIYCRVGCERTSTVAAIVLRKHFGQTSQAAMQTLNAAYAGEPKFAEEYFARPQSHLAAYDKVYK